MNKCKHPYLHSYSTCEGVGVFCGCGYFEFIKFQEYGAIKYDIM